MRDDIFNCIMQKHSLSQLHLLREWVQLTLEYKKAEDEDKPESEFEKEHHWDEEKEEKAGNKAKLPDKKPSTEEGPGRPRRDPGSDMAQFLDKSPAGMEMLARDLDVTRQYLDKLARGDATPSLELAGEIEDKSSGEVDTDSWSE